ncbi:hypothetical protein BH10PSE10_BH10PSE10_15680 [soil metagenome]
MPEKPKVPAPTTKPPAPVPAPLSRGDGIESPRSVHC